MNPASTRPGGPMAGVARALGRGLRRTIDALALPPRALGRRLRRPRRDRDPSAAPSVRDPGRAKAVDGARAVAEVLASPDPALRRLALETIGEFSSEREAVLIVEALPDPDVSVRCAAAAAAGRARVEETVFSLILALDDPAIEVRQIARESIEKITGASIELDPDLGAEERQVKIEELKRWWKQERLVRLAAALRAGPR